MSVNFSFVLITLFVQAGKHRVAGCSKRLPQFAVDSYRGHANFFPVALESLGLIDSLMQVFQFRKFLRAFHQFFLQGNVAAVFFFDVSVYPVAN